MPGKIPEKWRTIWHFSHPLSPLCRPLLSRWARASAFGALSICWRATARTTPAPMLMYGKEASNRKQEIDRQHRTIPNQRSQRPKDKYCGIIKTFGFFHNADYYGIPCIYLSDFALSSAKKSIPCLRNKCYNKAIDNRDLEVANMSGCLRLRNI